MENNYKHNRKEQMGMKKDVVPPKTKIVKNAARCLKCGEHVESVRRHDFVTCLCGAVAVDGGKDYLKRSGNPEDIVDLSVVEEIK